LVIKIKDSCLNAKFRVRDYYLRRLKKYVIFTLAQAELDIGIYEVNHFDFFEDTRKGTLSNWMMECKLDNKRFFTTKAFFGTMHYRKRLVRIHLRNA
jgi:hypothetical protein